MAKVKNGWIKIDRKLLDWEWFDDPNTLSVWIYLLLIANIDETTYKGATIKRGACYTSYSDIAQRTGLTERQARTALLHLEKSGQVSKQKWRHFSIISILNYDEHQGKCQNKRQNSGQNRSQNLYIKETLSKERVKKGVSKNRDTTRSSNTRKDENVIEWRE